MNNSRELIAQNIVDVLSDMDQPRLGRVSRELFNIEELAITQFPAVLVISGVEERDTVTMHTAGIRAGTITYQLRGYVRGSDIDTKRNELIERIEEALDQDRSRDLGNTKVLNSQIVQIDVVDRAQPLGEINITYEVEYIFTRGIA
jgi:hypothetical protein